MASRAAQKLLDLINYQNPGKGFTFDNVSFANVGVNTTSEPKDSSVRVVAVPNIAFRTSQWVYYNRIDLGVVFSKVEVQISDKALPTGIVVLRDLVDDINARYGTDFEPEDFQNAAIDTSHLPVSVTLRPTSDNPAYRGEFQAWIYKDVPELSEVLIDLDLVGFNYPEADLTKAQGLLYSYGISGSSQIGYLRNFVAGNSAEDEVLAGILRHWRRDPWVIDNVDSDFTLGGSVIAYNGLIADCPLPIARNTSFTNVLVLNLSTHCLKLSGRITIWYSR